MSVGETEGSVDQTIPIVLTQQELEALVQQQQQLQDIHHQAEPAEPEPQHTNVPTGLETLKSAFCFSQFHRRLNVSMEVWFKSSPGFPEGLAPADSLNDPAAESNGHELASSSSAVTSAVARLASTFGPTPPLTVSAVKSDSTFAEVTNGIAAAPAVSDVPLEGNTRAL